MILGLPLSRFHRTPASNDPCANVLMFFGDLMLHGEWKCFKGGAHGVCCISHLMGKKEISQRLCVCHLEPQMTPNERIGYVETQLWACECGEINAIICPYCGEVNAKGYSLCCNQLTKACAAVLARGGSQQKNKLLASV